MLMKVVVITVKLEMQIQKLVEIVIIILEVFANHKEKEEMLLQDTGNLFVEI